MKFVKRMFSQVFVCPEGGGISVEGGGLCAGGLCPGGLSRWSLSSGRGLHPGAGVSVKGGLSRGVSVQGGLCTEGLCPGGLSGGLYPGGLCPGEGSLSRGEVSVQGRGLCPGEGSLSR